MRLFEPLKQRIVDFLASGHVNPLWAARKGLSPNDYESLATSLATTRKAVTAEVIVDLTPFDRLGRKEVFDRFLLPLTKRHSCTFLTRNDGDFQAFASRSLRKRAGVLMYDEANKLVDATTSGTATSDRRRLLTLAESDRDLSTLHAYFCAKALNLIVRPGLERAHLDPNRVERDGRAYIPLGNRMLASCYLNSKRLFAQPATLFLVAFEVVRALYRSFDLTKPSSPCDYLIAPTNSALLIAGAVQAMTGIPAAVIDKLGPVAERSLATLNVSVDDIAGKRLGVVVDVSSTGSEIDRTVQYLDYRHARVVRVISCFSWHAATPRLCNSSILVHLCSPTVSPPYVYRSS